MTSHGPLLRRAHEEIRAARVLQAAGLPAQAVSRAYFAAFYAAEAALLHLGATHPKPSDVIAAFERLAVRDDTCDERAGQLLRALDDRRAQADDPTNTVPPAESGASIADAAIVVTLVEAWIDGRG